MYTADGKSDKNRLLAEYAPLVKKLAHQLKARLPQSVEIDDLIQTGMIGLLDAVNRYEEVHGAQFATYAVQRIRGAMLDELRSADWLPRSLRQNMRKIELAITTLQQRLGRAPAESEIARELDLGLSEYQEMLGQGGGHQLFCREDFHEGGEGEHFLDRIAGNDADDPLAQLMEAGFRAALIEAIEALPERDRIMMGLYYEQEMNLKEIGAVLGVSESRICQLHGQAIARLRATLRETTWIGVA